MQKDNMVTKKSKLKSIDFKENKLLVDIIFMLVLCAAGVFCKKLINPAANTITDALHIPGGISTGISLMFLVLASGITGRKWSASAMGFVQAAVALAMGSLGSMGFLQPIAYIVPGIVIDLVMGIGQKLNMSLRIRSFAACTLSSLSAAFFAEIVVFHLPVQPMMVYLCIATLTGAICGYLAGTVNVAVDSKKQKTNKETEESEK